jgi:hypothetical protein
MVLSAATLWLFDKLHKALGDITRPYDTSHYIRWLGLSAASRAIAQCDKSVFPDTTEPGRAAPDRATTTNPQI